MASEKAAITDKIQKLIEKSDWKSALSEMEKLFAVDQDPQVRVRMGDARQKLNQKSEAIKEYMQAADLFAEKGFVVKALAMYKLVLRLNPAYKQAKEQMEALHSNKTVTDLKLEPIEEGALGPQRSVIPLFSDFTQDEFNEFTQRMELQTIPAGRAVVSEGESGNSVFVLTRGSVKVYTAVEGKQVDLAVLQPSDFFGEIAFLTGKPRTATVEAIEESDVLEVQEEHLLDIISKHPRIKEVLQKYHEDRVKSTIEKVKGAV